jgi:hypothetical protein
MKDHALLVCGDWAIAHGNVESLAVIADELARRARGGLRAELLEIRELCKSDDGFAARRWYNLRPRMRSSVREHEREQSGRPQRLRVQR